MRRWVGSACHQPPRRTDFVYHKAPSSSDRTVVNFFLGLHIQSLVISSSSNVVK